MKLFDGQAVEIRQTRTFGTFGSSMKLLSLRIARCAKRHRDELMVDLRRFLSRESDSYGPVAVVQFSTDKAGARRYVPSLRRTRAFR